MLINRLMRHSMVSDFEGKQGRMWIGSKLIPGWFWIIPMSIETIKIGFEIWSEIFETYHISDSKAYHLTQIPNRWIFNPLMGHSMLSDFEEKQGHMSTESKLIPVWCWITPVSIESIRIGFENWFKRDTNEWIHPALRRLWFYPVPDSLGITLHCVSRDFSKTL